MGEAVLERRTAVDTRIKPGEVRNPNGRPPGSRNKLSEDFVDKLYQDFKAHGLAAIQEVRKLKPEIYIQVIAKLLPRDVKIELPQLQKIAHVIVDADDQQLIESTDVIDLPPVQGPPVPPKAIDSQSVTDTTSYESRGGGGHEVDPV